MLNVLVHIKGGGKKKKKGSRDHMQRGNLVTVVRYEIFCPKFDDLNKHTEKTCFAPLTDAFKNDISSNSFSIPSQ